MDRRQFCRSAAGASLACTLPFPFLSAAHASTSLRAVTSDGAETELERAAVREFGGELDGPVMIAGDSGYDAARRIWNGMHDKHPALIARCASSRDVVHAVTFARERNLLVAIRGGGHSWPGKSVCEGGIMIDLADLNQVDVNPERKIASAAGGALLNNLDTASLAHGLVTTAGVVSHTGVGGFTLGGGFGRLNRRYGLAIDNLAGARIVTADGKLRTVSASEEPELFWGLRGGGGNFGVVTQFDFRLHPFNRNVLSGLIMWPMAQARDVLEFYGEWSEKVSNDLYTGPLMVTTPEGDGLVGMEVVYAGDPALGEKELAPLRAIGKVAEDGIKVQDYMVLQTHEDATFHHGVRSYAKNGMVKHITQGLVDAMIEAYRPDPRLAFFTHTAGGAVKQVGELDTAFPHRNAETMVIVAGAWLDPAEDASAMAAAREWFAALAPFTGGYYDNIEFEGDSSAAGNYGPAYSRLQKLKSQYDAGNLFRLNSNIKPA
ncbi:FAD-binding oxidoreductase [Parahaliea maris]|uniref:FAD-binding oxidoreductase n=1 Tax=Parahaliea maris TaxID=2716870 RepID=A0A5C9A2Y9_9GAMM|nr:FAD-binding protein [Parahaliea maris]TXS94312.1 FAD-binding oxidoreductase [Parahaliea maris]